MTQKLLREIVGKINSAEVRLASIRQDERAAVPSNPLETVGEVVKQAEAHLEEAKRLIREALS